MLASRSLPSSVSLNSLKAVYLSIPFLRFCLLSLDPAKIAASFSNGSSWTDGSYSSNYWASWIAASCSFDNSILLTGLESAGALPSPNSPYSTSLPTPSSLMEIPLATAPSDSWVPGTPILSASSTFFPSYLSFLKLFLIWARSSFTYLMDVSSSISSLFPVRNWFATYWISYCYSGVYGS